MTIAKGQARKDAITFEPISFTDIGGWQDDDHKAAFLCFLRSCQILLAKPTAKDQTTHKHDQRFLDICQSAMRLGNSLSRVDAQNFFETFFVPHTVKWAQDEGLVTGYYEPILNGSLTKDNQFHIPVYAKPEDLVPLINDQERAKFNDEITAMQKTDAGLKPYPTRQQIEDGALSEKGLELLYLEDPVASYFMHIQGSGLIHLTNGDKVRLTYAAKNGHPYSSVGRALIEKGIIAREDMSLQAIKIWMRKHPEKAKEFMWINKSYIFFRQLPEVEAKDGPLGAQQIPLTKERSLAVDAGIHPLGTPVFVTAPTHQLKSENGFRQLMIAQDVGSAIAGPERGDIFWGTGSDAGEYAGRTAHRANFTVLLPRGEREI